MFPKLLESCNTLKHWITDHNEALTSTMEAQVWQHLTCKNLHHSGRTKPKRTTGKDSYLYGGSQSSLLLVVEGPPMWIPSPPSSPTELLLPWGAAPPNAAVCSSDPWRLRGCGVWDREMLLGAEAVEAFFLPGPKLKGNLEERVVVAHLGQEGEAYG